MKSALRVSPFVFGALLSTSLVFAAACDRSKPADVGDDEKPAAADERDGSTAADAASEAKPPAKPGGAQLTKTTFELGTQQQAAQAKARFTEHLATGRKAVKAKEFATGIAELEKAKKISPTNSSVLGELGWAYFQNGELEKAERELKLSLSYVTKDGTKGAVLYNLGRVEEQRGKRELAADLYRQSVAVRQNDVVQKRLDSLGLGDEINHAECVFSEPNSVPSDLCQAVADRLNAEQAAADWTCEYNPTEQTQRGDDEQVAVAAGESAYSTVFALSTGEFKATVFSLWDRELLMTEQFFVAVVLGDQYWVDALQMVEHPGVGYADSNMNEVKLTAKEVNGRGHPEIVVSWSTGWHDMDPGIEYMEDGSHRGEAVISIDDGKPAWLGVFSLERQHEAGDMDPDEWGAMKSDSEKSGYRYSIAYDGEGAVTVTHEAGDADAGMKVGAYPITESVVRCPSEIPYY